jgi:hypothetical protein
MAAKDAKKATKKAKRFVGCTEAVEAAAEVEAEVTRREWSGP